MTFGQLVRQARESRGWTRFRLHLIIKEHFSEDGITITEATIKFLETGRTNVPRGTTRAMLYAVMPELTQITT